MADDTPDDTTGKGPDQTSGRHKVLVRARNGDVIRYDDTGLVVTLSDRVIADIALRLGAAIPSPMGAQPGAPLGAQAGTATPSTPFDDLRLEKLDVWDAVRADDWLFFDGRLPGKQGVRRFRLAEAGGHVIADAPGPLCAILGIGGARAALAEDRRADFPQHILAPADDIGAVGHAGIERAADTHLLEHLRELTHEALAAEAFLNWQIEAHGPLPLFVTRVETDESADAATLAKGPAVDNLMIAAANVRRAAEALDKTVRVLAVTLDYALEDTSGSATGYRDGVLALMSRIEAGFRKLDLPPPLFITRFERGSNALPDHHAIRGQWELIWNHGEHRLLFSAPGYMFAHDDTDRATDESRRQMAEMTAAAASDPEAWRCPVFHLAEITATPEGARLLVRARAASGLVLAAGDAACADQGVGLRLIGDQTGAAITSVALAPDDPQALVVMLDRMPAGPDLQLAYAIGPALGAGDPASFAVRDDWALLSATGATLHRWALPCLLPIHPGKTNARA